MCAPFCYTYTLPAAAAAAGNCVSCAGKCARCLLLNGMCCAVLAVLCGAGVCVGLLHVVQLLRPRVLVLSVLLAELCTCAYIYMRACVCVCVCV